jgi:ribosome-associated protein
MKDPATEPDVISPREKAELLLKAALSKKAIDPILLRLEGLTSLTDYFLILSARSARQVKAVAEAVLLDGRKLKFTRYSAEGLQEGNWALLDYGDVVVHVFRPEIREFYDLEGLWAEAPRETFAGDLAEAIAAAARSEEDDFDDDW